MKLYIYPSFSRVGEPEDIIERFWSHVDIGDPDQCWPWKLSKDKDGYGRFQRYHWEQVRSHKYAFWLVYGEPKYWVLHNCDNPPCSNPNHLYDGQPWQNSRDRDDRGRANPPMGSRNGMAKLDEEKVVLIREVYRTSGLPQHKVAQMFDISQQQVSRIVNGELWRNVE